MKNIIHFQFHGLLIIWLAMLMAVARAAAQATEFYQISGPAASTILSFNQEGMLTWSNALPGATYTVQMATAMNPPNWADYIQIPTTSALNIDKIIDFNPPTGMALIPAGSYTIGNSIGDSDIADAIPTTVNVSAFYMDVNLVSSSQWLLVYNYATNNGYVFDNPGSAKGGTYPIEMVDWFDSVKWSNARSQQAGLTPVYYTDAAMTMIYTNGQDANPYPNWAANGYRLPTEAEWEKAARGGLYGLRFPWGDTISELQANYGGSPSDLSYDLGPGGYNDVGSIGGTDPATSPVGSFPPNNYGLYDMAGNVEEWCWDWYMGPPYPTGSPYLGGTDPRGPASSTYSERVLRGGNWSYDARASRTAYRDYINEPAATYIIIGFRCVRAY
jgi:formylglycine-generating enzyme required for sulfatase activity